MEQSLSSLYKQALDIAEVLFRSPQQQQPRWTRYSKLDWLGPHRFQTAQYVLGHNLSNKPGKESTSKGLQALLPSLISFRKVLELQIHKMRMVGLVKKSLMHSTS